GLVAARTVAAKEGIPEKFLEGILLALKNARVVSSERGREGGYRLRKPPREIFIGDVVRLIDGPLAPFADVVELQRRVKTEGRHPGLFDLFLEIRNAASAIADRTSLADLVERDRRVLAGRGVPESRR
ncbi:MAG TPA: Rrf2 family transcriptional regulator, partial [Vicinamibacteria bacterium]